MTPDEVERPRDATARAIEAVGAMVAHTPIVVVIELDGLEELARVPMSRSFALLFDALAQVQTPVVLVADRSSVWWHDPRHGWRGDIELTTPITLGDVVAGVHARVPGSRAIVIAGDPSHLERVPDGDLALVVAPAARASMSAALWVPGVIAVRSILWWLVGARTRRRQLSPGTAVAS